MDAALRIVTAQPADADADALAELGRRTWTDTYTGMGYYTPDIVEGYTSKTFHPDAIRRELADPAVQYLQLLDVDAQAPIGYAKLVDREPAACIPPAARNAVYLERIYLARGAQGRGLGSRLLDAACAAALARGRDHLWLSVWPVNVAAVAFYRRHGFHVAGQWEWRLDLDDGRSFVDLDDVLLRRLLSSPPR